MRFFSQVMVITAKDLRAEMRTKEAINASFAFALVILLILSFAFDPTEDDARDFRRPVVDRVHLCRDAGAQPQFRPGTTQ